MSLLGKFDAVEIKTTDQISDADKAFCEAHQKAYEDAKSSLLELIFIWEEMFTNQQRLLSGFGNGHEIYISAGSSIRISRRNIQDQITEMHRSFVSNLIRYFCKTYHFEISDYEIKAALFPKKPEWRFSPEYEKELDEYEAQKHKLSLHYTQIVEQIMKQLGGKRLNEYALFQIKDACWRSAWRNEKPQYERTKQVIRFYSAVNCDYELYECTKKILRALALFETNVIDQCPYEWDDLYKYHGPGYNAYDFESGNRITKFRLFRNGRMDVRFKEEAYAVQFVEEYLRTIPWEGTE